MKIQSETLALLNLGLAGQPNTGKSSLFNALTGDRQHVGNWPGKTIERKSGFYLHDDKHVEIVDLPGTYSLRANSAEELISRNHIVSDATDALIVMVDASQLQRSMYLLAEITGIGIPVILACTMMDIAEKQGKSIDTETLEHNLGVPVAAINAVTGKGIEALKERIFTLKQKPAQISRTPLHKKYHVNLLLRSAAAHGDHHSDIDSIGTAFTASILSGRRHDPGYHYCGHDFFMIPIWILVFIVLENIGFISRIAYVFNSWMERLGLHGKSILPFISGFLCNIIGVAGARVIDSHAQRRTTIATSLAVPCLGAWTAVLLMAPIFFGIKAIWIVLALSMGLQGLKRSIRKTEETDPFCLAFPRFKCHDDIASIAISFS